MPAAKKYIDIYPETGILLPEKDRNGYIYTKSDYILNISIDYMEEYINKKVKVTFDGVEYTPFVTFGSFTSHGTTKPIIIGDLIGDYGNFNFDNLPFGITWGTNGAGNGEIGFDF